jgi:hypothetical protein
MIENVGRTDTKIGNAGRDRLSRAEPSREIARRGAGPLSISVSGSLTRTPSGDVAVRCRACGAVRSSTGRGGILTGSSPGDLYVRCMGRHSAAAGDGPAYLAHLRGVRIRRRLSGWTSRSLGSPEGQARRSRGCWMAGMGRRPCTQALLTVEVIAPTGRRICRVRTSAPGPPCRRPGSRSWRGGSGGGRPGSGSRSVTGLRIDMEPRCDLRARSSRPRARVVLVCSSSESRPRSRSLMPPRGR